MCLCKRSTRSPAFARGPASRPLAPSPNPAPVRTPSAPQWVAGLPLSWLLAFPLGLGEAGLWLGITAGAGLQFAVASALLFRWDWAREAARVRELMAGAAAAGRPPPPELAAAH
jgi:hypothetical protein